MRKILREKKGNEYLYRVAYKRSEMIFYTAAFFRIEEVNNRCALYKIGNWGRKEEIYSICINENELDISISELIINHIENVPINSEINLDDNPIEINHDPEELNRAFKIVNDREIEFDELESFDEEYTMILRNMNNKVELVKDLFITHLSDEYDRNTRTSEHKKRVFRNLKNLKYSKTYIDALFEQLMEIKNIVLKNQDFIDYLNSDFFYNVRDLFEKGRIGNKLSRYTRFYA